MEKHQLLEAKARLLWFLELVEEDLLKESDRQTLTLLRNDPDVTAYVNLKVDEFNERLSRPPENKSPE